MSPRAKSIVLIIATFVIGIVVGALLNARLAEERFERIASLRSERGFMRFVEDAVQPHDEQQRAAIRAVLGRSAERMTAHQVQVRQEVRALMDSTRTELEAVLTPDQLERLDQWIEEGRQRRMMRQKGRRDDGRRIQRGRRSDTLAPLQGPD